MNHWKTLFSDDIFEVSYDALVKDPKFQIEQALRFLGLEWDERCARVPAAGRAIKTASVWQAREPIHARFSGRADHQLKQLQNLQKYIACALLSRNNIQLEAAPV